MLVLSQAHPYAPEESADDTIRQTMIARDLGFPVFHLPQALTVDEVEAAFEGLAPLPQPTPAIWIGFIPSFELYAAVYAAAAARGAVLLNDPDQHRTAFELDRAYPYIEGWTPPTVVVTGPDEVDGALAQIPLPVFVRGAAMSDKGRGPDGCFGTTRDEVVALVEGLLAKPKLSRGRVLIRQLVPLRSAPIEGYGLPAGREFRVFLHRGQVLAHGFYWPYLLDFAKLDPAEEAQMLGVATAVASRMPTPYLAVDVAQAQDGRWIAIETGDPQFSGLGLVPADAFIAAVGRATTS